MTHEGLLKPHNRAGILVLDEIGLQAGLVYDPRTGEFVGSVTKTAVDIEMQVQHWDVFAHGRCSPALAASANISSADLLFCILGMRCVDR